MPDLITYTSKMKNTGYPKAYLRYTDSDRLLIVNNLEHQAQQLSIQLPADVLAAFHLTRDDLQLTDLLTGKESSVSNFEAQIPVHIPANQSVILKF